MKKLTALFVLITAVSASALAGDMSVVSVFAGGTSFTGLRMAMGSTLYGEINLGPVSLSSGAAPTTLAGSLDIGYVMKNDGDSSCALTAGISGGTAGSARVMARHEVWINKKLAVGIQGRIANVPLVSGSATTFLDATGTYVLITF